MQKAGFSHHDASHLGSGRDIYMILCLLQAEANMGKLQDVDKLSEKIGQYRSENEQLRSVNLLRLKAGMFMKKQQLENECLTGPTESRCKKRSSGFPTRCDTNRPVHVTGAGQRLVILVISRR